MVDVDVEAILKARKVERQDRLHRIADSTAVPKVRVLPATDEMRKLLKHPISGMGFRSEGSVEWPHDTFTKRRLREGAIALETPEQRAASQSAESEQPAKPGA